MEKAENRKTQNRIGKIQQALRESRADSLLIEDRSNRRYLTGADVWQGSLIVTEEKAVLLVDFRYYQMAISGVKGCDVKLCKNVDEGIGQMVKDWNIHWLGFETGGLSYLRHKKLEAIIGGARLDEETCGDKLVKEQRKIKDAEELSYLRQAQEISDRAYDHILNVARAGMKESDIRMALGTYMIHQGSQGFDIGYISSSGEKTSLPHGGFGDKVIEKGDLLMIDFGAVINGYRSDMTRTFGFGTLSDRQREVYRLVLEAQEKALSGIRPGMKGKEVDKIARDYIHRAGYEGCFEHGLGHSIGLDGHENPRFNEVEEELLRPGVVMTVEPGIYLPHEFGVRIEDMGVVTEDGFENFTTATKELITI